MKSNIQKKEKAALNIEAPRYVSVYVLDQKNGGFHIYLDFHRGSTFTCPHCGQPHVMIFLS